MDPSTQQRESEAMSQHTSIAQTTNLPDNDMGTSAQQQQQSRRLVEGGIARIDIDKLQRNIENEVTRYSNGMFPRQSQRYYRLMSVLHITRLLYHDGLCDPIHREYYRRLAQIHQQQAAAAAPAGAQNQAAGVQG
ncbi:hypothetical protein H4219_000912 [Mycoemilia scoparia]|uniref:Uncharacterized protein n=1 Tax=Mycoemilia scoparia TaxID=417184 RepID=A0A9W8A7C2_9FUNG|nr:hypothetical protein H4219_000912 [Mycoemilia scoparia]